MEYFADSKKFIRYKGKICYRSPFNNSYVDAVYRSGVSIEDTYPKCKPQPYIEIKKSLPFVQPLSKYSDNTNHTQKTIKKTKVRIDRSKNKKSYKRAHFDKYIECFNYIDSSYPKYYNFEEQICCYHGLCDCSYLSMEDYDYDYHFEFFFSDSD